jgi:glycerol-3-phosphate dehydrogenase
MAPATARLIARELGRDETWQAQQVDAFRDLAEGYLV